mgnify:CR=1 FL=1
MNTVTVVSPAIPAQPPASAGAATAAPRGEASRGDPGAFAALFDLSLAATPQPPDGAPGERRTEARVDDATDPPAAGGDPHATATATEPAPDAWLAAQIAARASSSAPADPATAPAHPTTGAVTAERAARTADLPAGGRAPTPAPAGADGMGTGPREEAAPGGRDAGATPPAATVTAAVTAHARRAGATPTSAADAAITFDAAPRDGAAPADTAPVGAPVAPAGDPAVAASPAGAGAIALPADAGAVALAAVTSAADGGGPAAGAPTEARLPQPPQSPAFAAALGQQVGLWIRHGVQQAVLQLNPADLGPVAVHIALDGQRAHVDFSAAHAATRATLEASLPALAAALRDSGLMLAGGGVFDRPRDRGHDAGAAATAAVPGGAERAADAPAPVVLRRRGVVDLVA